MNSDGLELALNFLKDMLRKLNINITMEHFIKTRIIVGLSGGFFYDIDEESSKNSKSNTYSSEVTEDSLKIFLLSATEFKSQIDEFVGLDSGIKSHENNNSTNMRIIILQQYGRNTKGLPVIFIYIEDIKYWSYIIDWENVTPDLLDYSFRNNFKKSYLIFKSISKMTKRRMNKMILKLQNYYGEFQTSDKHSIEEAWFESEKYVNEIKELVNIFKDHYNKIVKFIGMRIQKQGYLWELLGRFITNINWEFNKWVILFHETEYIEPAKFNVDKIIFKHCKIGNQLLTFNDIEMSSRHSIASYSEYVLDDDTIDFILGFWDEYQFANRWLIMLTKLFTSDQLYEIQLRYKGKPVEGSSQNLDMNIVKEKSSIDEGYYDNRSLSDISRRNDRDESKGSSKYNEDTAHTNFYAMFNTGQFSHNVYVHIDVLESKFFILALFESKHCTRLEINWNTLKVDLSRKSYHSVNFHDQQMKHLLLKNWEITEHIEGMRKISRNERLADERALEVLNNHKDTLFTMKLLKLTNLIYSLSRLELSGAYEINKVGLTELLDEYECTRDNHTSRWNPINIYIFADKEAKITKELHKYVKEREIDTRREFKLNFPLKRFL